MNPIGWCDETWNPTTGCSAISEACEHCYAQRMAYRLAGRYGYPAAIHDPWGNQVPWGAFKPTLHEDKLDVPLRWRKPRFVFVVSMGDLFHEDVREEWLVAVFGAMFMAPQHTYLILTKRPLLAQEFLLNAPQWRQNPPENIWLGVTAENQQRADERIPILLDTPAAKRFVSVEPMLGPVDLAGTYSNYLAGWDTEAVHARGCDGTCRNCPDYRQVQTPALDWVICGPENGPGKRPMELDWARDLRDQCQAAGVPFWYKGGMLDGQQHHERPRLEGES